MNVTDLDGALGRMNPQITGYPKGASGLLLHNGQKDRILQTLIFSHPGMVAF